jgi:hypothetical protein
VATDQEKAKHYAERIAEINRQVGTGTLNFEQARLSIDTYKWLASKLDPSTYGNQQKDTQELNVGKMHLDAIRKLGSG